MSWAFDFALSHRATRLYTLLGPIFARILESSLENRRSGPDLGRVRESIDAYRATRKQRTAGSLSLPLRRQGELSAIDDGGAVSEVELTQL